MSRVSHNITVDGSVFTNNYMGISMNTGWSGVSIISTQIGIDYDGSVAGGYTGINTNNRTSYDPDYCRLIPVPPGVPQPRTTTTIPFAMLTQAVGDCEYQERCTVCATDTPAGVTAPCIVYDSATTIATSCVVSIFENTTL